jgi:hypothetical protein
VAQVNATFSENFKSVGCAGDVVLHEAPGEDFEKYAIEIRWGLAVPHWSVYMVPQ